jgi:uncharacterized membrane protein YqgA involved in biofilm formation
MVGTLANAATVLVGGLVGLLFRGRLPEAAAKSLEKALGLCVCVIGISGALQGDAMLLVVSLALGTLAGEALGIDRGLNRLGETLQRALAKGGGSGIAQGFVDATLLFCVGTMSIVGSFESGLRGDHSIILTKAVLDGVSAVVLTSTLGAGVLLSAAVILLYQGGLVLFAGALQGVLTPALVTQFSAAGGVMILGIGCNMALGARCRVANMLPGLLVAVGYYYLFLV